MCPQSARRLVVPMLSRSQIIFNSFCLKLLSQNWISDESALDFSKKKLKSEIPLMFSPELDNARKSLIMDFFEMTKNPRNLVFFQKFLFLVTSFARNFYFCHKKVTRCLFWGLYLKICPSTPPKFEVKKTQQISVIEFFGHMCLMCAHTKASVKGLFC